MFFSVLTGIDFISPQENLWLTQDSNPEIFQLMFGVAWRLHFMSPDTQPSHESLQGDNCLSIFVPVRVFQKQKTSLYCNVLWIPIFILLPKKWTKLFWMGYKKLPISQKKVKGLVCLIIGVFFPLYMRLYHYFIPY